MHGELYLEEIEGGCLKFVNEFQDNPLNINTIAYVLNGRIAADKIFMSYRMDAFISDAKGNGLDYHKVMMKL